MLQSRKYLINTQKAINETIDNETIIINLETGSYYSMNQAGTALWNAILNNTPIPVNEKSIIDFMDTLKNEGLVFEGDVVAYEPLADESVFADPKIEKYEDMQEMLLADPIHDVETAGWPNLKN